MAAPELDPVRIVDANFRAGADQVSSLPAPTGLEIAFAGRSNVGKSSLMNALCGRKNLVRTSGTPGCTRQLSFFETRSADGAVVTLVDLPGYGYAKRSKTERNQWATLIETYLLERPTLGVVAVLVDVRRGLEPDDDLLFEMLRGEPRVRRAPLACALVATKLDKMPTSQRQAALSAFSKKCPFEVHGVSIEMPETHRALWRRLRRLGSVGDPQIDE